MTLYKPTKMKKLENKFNQCPHCNKIHSSFKYEYNRVVCQLCDMWTMDYLFKSHNNMIRELLNGA
jgi:transcription elongation factor Elf1